MRCNAGRRGPCVSKPWRDFSPSPSSPPASLLPGIRLITRPACLRNAHELLQRDAAVERTSFLDHVDRPVCRCLQRLMMYPEFSMLSCHVCIPNFYDWPIFIVLIFIVFIVSLIGFQNKENCHGDRPLFII